MGEIMASGCRVRYWISGLAVEGRGSRLALRLVGRRYERAASGLGFEHSWSAEATEQHDP